MPENVNTLLVNRAIISEGERFLLLQRSSDDSHNAGLWEFPGGKVDAGEELIDGLTREVLEETGLLIGVTKSVAHIESELIRSGKYEGRLYVALFYAAQRLGGTVVISDEHCEARWEGYDAAMNYDLTPESKRALGSVYGLGLA